MKNCFLSQTYFLDFEHTHSNSSEKICVIRPRVNSHSINETNAITHEGHKSTRKDLRDFLDVFFHCKISLKTWIMKKVRGNENPQSKAMPHKSYAHWH